MTTETELSSVNSVLGAIGQSPVSRIYDTDTVTGDLIYINPEISVIHQIITEVDKDVQNEGWIFNTEFNYEMVPNNSDEITIPVDVLRLDVTSGQVYRTTDVVRRSGKLYDRYNHTYKFTTNVCLDFTWKLPFEELPSAFQRYIILRASGRAAAQLVTNPELVQLLAQQEAQARAACMEYECNQGDHTFFGIPSGTIYQSYQPYRTLAR